MRFPCFVFFSSYKLYYTFPNIIFCKHSHQSINIKKSTLDLVIPSIILFHCVMRCPAIMETFLQAKLLCLTACSCILYCSMHFYIKELAGI